jgi:F0F1-type ATP synthase membrane subunit c/vacuolar-type H+-ATPase subunit K
MVVLALIALAVAAAAPAVAAALGPLSRGRLEVPEWASSVVALPALGVAALASTRTTPVTGFALGATLVLCVLAAATAGAPLVLATFKIARRQPDGSPAPDAGPLRGGRVIGILERLAVAASILATWPEGIAIVLAVKGLARYPELREPHASEQFIMGTFVSVLWAIAVCGTGRALITSVMSARPDQRSLREASTGAGHPRAAAPGTGTSAGNLHARAAAATDPAKDFRPAVATRDLRIQAARAHSHGGA